MGSLENIAKAKGEIFAGLAKDGVAVINQDSRFADDWKNLNIGRHIITFGITTKADVMSTYTEFADASEMTLITPAETVRFKLNILGIHNIGNALAASATAIALGISTDDIANGLTAFGGVYGRLQRKVGLNGAVLIDDTYNANPDSMRVAIDVLASQSGDRILILGAMGELGATSADMHYAVGAYAKAAGLKALYCLGDNSGEMGLEIVRGFGTGGQYFESLVDLKNAIQPQLNSHTTLLIKGSRFMKMERVIAMLQAQQALEEKSVIGGNSCY